MGRGGGGGGGQDHRIGMVKRPQMVDFVYRKSSSYQHSQMKI